MQLNWIAKTLIAMAACASVAAPVLLAECPDREPDTCDCPLGTPSCSAPTGMDNSCHGVGSILQNDLWTSKYHDGTYAKTGTIAQDGNPICYSEITCVSGIDEETGDPICYPGTVNIQDIRLVRQTSVDCEPDPP